MLQRRKIILSRGFEPLNGAREPAVNRFLKLCNGAHFSYLLKGVVAWLMLSSLLISYVFVQRGCVEVHVTFQNCALLVFSMLIGGSGPRIKDTDCCPGMSVVAASVSFLTDSMIIAIFVNRITSPKAQIAMSSSVLLKMRNNRLLFQIRIMNEYGHPLENVVINSCYYRMSVSDENESFTNIVPVEFQHNFVSHAPLNVSHFIDETSPFYGEELENFVGTLEVTVSAYDPILGASATTTNFYDKSVILIAHDWETMFMNSFSELGNYDRIACDAAKLSATTPLPAELSAKINDAISWNKFNRDVGGTSAPSVLKTLHGGKPRVPGIGLDHSERNILLAAQRDRSQVLHRPVVDRAVDAKGSPLVKTSPPSNPRSDSPISLGSDYRSIDDSETEKLAKRKKTSLGLSIFRHKKQK